MKNLYRIFNHKGAHICNQVASSEEEAVELARDFYGHRSARRAEFVRVW